MTTEPIRTATGSPSLPRSTRESQDEVSAAAGAAVKEPATAPARPRYEPSSTVGEVAGYLARLDVGELAQFRKSNAARNAAFWKLAQEVLEPAGMLSPEKMAAISGETMPVTEWERRWAQVACLMAHMQFRKLLSTKVRAGVALGTFLSEHRLQALLRSSGDTLYSELRAAVQFACSKQVHLDFSRLAEILLFDGTDSGRKAREAVARDYYRQQAADKTSRAGKPKTRRA